MTGVYEIGGDYLNILGNLGTAFIHFLAGSRGTGRVFPAPERVKPVISLPTPSGKTIHDIQVYESHRGNVVSEYMDF